MSNFNSNRYYCHLVYELNGTTLDNGCGYFSSVKSAKTWSANRGTMGEPYVAKLYKFNKEGTDVERDICGNAIIFSTWKPKVSNLPNKCGNPPAWQTLKSK